MRDNFYGGRKKEMKYTEKTKRGSVDTNVATDGEALISCEHEVTEGDIVNPKVREVIGKVRSLDIEDPYALTYVDNLEEAYIMYNIRGLKSQLSYILVNLPEDSEEAAIVEDQIKQLE